MRTRIVYEDGEVIVACKPAGLATQSSGVGQADMASELKNYLNSPYLGIVHRLDQPVEGLLVFGKTKQAAAALTRQLSDGRLSKRYYAVVARGAGEDDSWQDDDRQEGDRQDERFNGGRQNDKRQEGSGRNDERQEGNGRNDERQEGSGRNDERQEDSRQNGSRQQERELTDYLYKTKDNRAQIVPESAARETGAKLARLKYRIVENVSAEEIILTEGISAEEISEKNISAEGVTAENMASHDEKTGDIAGRNPESVALAEISIDTGRFHQIRAQMSHAGMPLLGDAKYGTKRSAALSEKLRVRLVALCAYDLRFVHPGNKKAMHFQVRPQAEIFQIFSKINQMSQS